MEQCRGGCSHEMVNSPATAATMAYPTLEEERRSSGHEYDHHRHRQRVRIVAVRPEKQDPNLDDAPVASVDTATILNRDFAYSYRAVAEATEGQSSWEPSECPWIWANQRSRRRSRKQSLPRKVTCTQDFEDDELPCLDGNKQDTGQEDTADSGANKETPETEVVNELRKRYRSRSDKELLKCRLCPDDAFARGSICRPYHTKASLTLHKYWKHDRRKRCPTNSATKPHPPSRVSSITLKATVFTSPGYGYHR